MLKPLSKKENFTRRKGPVVLVIMDGVGFGKYKEGDAVANSLTPHLDSLIKNNPFTKLKAHGRAVGLPSDDDMGNSEVGHNAMGCGRVYSQGAMLVNDSIKTGRMFEGAVWQKLVSKVKTEKSTLHFIGLFSDGNVHSNNEHLKAMIVRAKEEGAGRVRIHILLDGRDVGETSALEYIEPFEEFLSGIRDISFDCEIASGGGRMAITMDRYGANWSMVERGWHTHVLGEGRMFKSASEAVKVLRSETGAIDQDIPPFVIEKDGKPCGTIEDRDSVVFYNYRGDRALEITEAFEKKSFTRFDRKRYPIVEYAGMMEYDGDLHVPAQYLVSPPSIDRTIGEYLAGAGVRQLAISETQKYGHVTYFFNGNRTGKFNGNLEDYVEITSDSVPFEERPWMKCADITDYILDALKSDKYDFIRLNFPNGDMVGHTGIYEAVVCSMEALDLCLGRLVKAVKNAGGVMVVTADHGNADDMFEHDKDGSVKKKEGNIPKAKTAHSLNPVPCVVFNPQYKGEYKKELNEGLGISSIAATCIELLGYNPPEEYDKSVLSCN